MYIAHHPAHQTFHPETISYDFVTVTLISVNEIPYGVTI